MEHRSNNPMFKQSEIAKNLGMSSSTVQRCRHDTKKLSSYRIPPNSNKRKQKTSYCEHDLERPQLNSNDLKKPQLTSNENDKPVSKKVNTKNKIKGGDSNDNQDHRSSPLEQAFSST